MALKLTDNAIRQIKEVIASQNMSLDLTNVRVGIRGKSCSGPVYAFGLDEEVDLEQDEVSIQDGVKVVHHKQFTDDLNNVTVDFKEVEDRRGFTFSNPLQVLGGCGTGGCGSGGCGSSSGGGSVIGGCGSGGGH
jgi:iron-sulfur cluster assembly accessory protein